MATLWNNPHIGLSTKVLHSLMCDAMISGGISHTSLSYSKVSCSMNYFPVNCGRISLSFLDTWEIVGRHWRTSDNWLALACIPLQSSYVNNWGAVLIWVVVSTPWRVSHFQLKAPGFKQQTVGQYGGFLTVACWEYCRALVQFKHHFHFQTKAKMKSWPWWSQCEFCNLHQLLFSSEQVHLWGILITILPLSPGTSLHDEAV